MMADYSDIKHTTPRCSKSLQHGVRHKRLHDQLRQELDRMNETLHVLDEIYSGISLSYCITSSELDRQGP